MSMRHLQIDRVVDMAWFRNREVSQSRSLAESDEFCFKYALERFQELSDITSAEKPLQLEIYHTGFEPASVGFYRALVAVLTADPSLQAEWAREKTPAIFVVPRYFKGGVVYEPSRDRNGQPIEWFLIYFFARLMSNPGTLEWTLPVQRLPGGISIL